MLSDSASTMSFGKLTIPGIDGAGCKWLLRITINGRLSILGNYDTSGDLFLLLSYSRRDTKHWHIMGVAYVELQMTNSRPVSQYTVILPPVLAWHGMAVTAAENRKMSPKR